MSAAVEGHLAATVLGGLAPELVQDLSAAALTMARRFHAGATMWCVSPSWPRHARHLADEFVDPVIGGEPALAALVGPAEDVVDGLRASVACGDLVVAVSARDDATVVDLMRRAPAWGATTVWIGAGERPVPGAADHPLWLDDRSGDVTAASFQDRFTLLCRLLRERTHVGLGHPGQLAAPVACEGETCITCSDEGELAEVIAVSGAQARVRTARGPRTIDVTLVDEAVADDLLLVHAGSAIARVPDAVVPEHERERT